MNNAWKKQQSKCSVCRKNPKAPGCSRCLACENTPGWYTRMVPIIPVFERPSPPRALLQHAEVFALLDRLQTSVPSVQWPNAVDRQLILERQGPQGLFKTYQSLLPLVARADWQRALVQFAKSLPRTSDQIEEFDEADAVVLVAKIDQWVRAFFKLDSPAPDPR